MEVTGKGLQVGQVTIGEYGLSRRSLLEAESLNHLSGDHEAAIERSVDPGSQSNRWCSLFMAHKNINQCSLKLINGPVH